MTEKQLAPCPFCGGKMMFRGALWPSEGDTEGVIHASPVECGFYEFNIGASDESTIEAWNRRAASPPAGAEVVAYIDNASLEMLRRHGGVVAHIGTRSINVSDHALYLAPPTAEEIARRAREEALEEAQAKVRQALVDAAYAAARGRADATSVLFAAQRLCDRIFEGLTEALSTPLAGADEGGAT